ncbi:hypothetical protein NDU88_002441 [Pleurodeles waltl]|uniref:Uncharacterized protein n=1 Tax=Pleurodeles waltl TaxID=8319 RepID=A0AAV7TLU9_PLEWA|nr:hypothetical protein NDU88_002441 [Pleurodeles waltl]
MSGSAGNVGRQAALRAQGVLEDKQRAPGSSPAPDWNCKSKMYVKFAGEHGGGLTIPLMFKTPRNSALPVGSTPTESTNFECPRDLVAVVAEVGDGGGEPVSFAPFSCNRTLLQADGDADGNGPLATSNFAGILSLASLHLSAPSSSGEGQSVLFEGRSCQLPQGPVPLGNVMLARDPEIAHCDRAVAIHPLAGADLRPLFALSGPLTTPGREKRIALL